MEDLVGLFAIVLTLMIPIVAIVFSMIKKVSKSKLDNELRLEIVRSGNTSPEVVKELLKTPEKKASDNKIVALRWGCALAGLSPAANEAGQLPEFERLVGIFL